MKSNGKSGHERVSVRPARRGESVLSLTGRTLAAVGPNEVEKVPDHEMVGKIGRVTGRVSPGELGEVMVPVRGGTEAFHAYAADREEVLTIGTRIVVVEYLPPRTVVVTRM
jgi:hypothetical protein